MKALRLVGVREMDLIDLPVPNVPEGWVLVEVKACGVCMTDVHMFIGEFPVKKPVTLGHEFSGIVRDAGGAGGAAYRGADEIRPVREGDRVTVNPLLYCGSCAACLSGRFNLCVSPKAVGGAGDTVIDGAFAEYVTVPLSSLGPLPEGMEWGEAAMVEPVSCCIHGIDRSRIRQGDSVAVIGAGAVGLILIQLALLSGAGRVISVETNGERRAEAVRNGAEVSLDPRDPSFMEVFQAAAGGRGVDAVIEAAGSGETSELAMKLVKKGGRVNLFGVSAADATFPCSPFAIFYNEIDLVGTYALTPDTFRCSLALIGSGRLNVKPLISHALPLEKGVEGFEMVLSGVGLKKMIFPSAGAQAQAVL